MKTGTRVRGFWRAGAGPRNRLRAFAGVHRGLWVAAPVFWGAFAVFLHPGYGILGFLLHFFACLPRGRKSQAVLFLAFPLLALAFCARCPSLTLRGTPWHREIAADAAPRVRAGTVATLPSPSSGGGTSFLLNTEDGRYRVALRPGTASPAWGARVEVDAAAEAPGQPPNPGQLDMRRVLRAQGAVALLRAASWRQKTPPPAWKRLLLRLRADLAASLDRNVPAAAVPLMKGALLNDVSGISQETQDAFLRSGMQHVLAISGQHIGLLIAFLLLLSRCARIPRKAAFLAAGVLTAAYVPLTGAPVSVVRSGITLAWLLPGIFLERPSSGIHALCLTAALDLILWPYDALNLGFQLSYAATFMLILCSRPALACAEKLGLGPRTAAVAQTVFLSLWITAITYLPLAASTHAVAPWGIAGNLLTIPLSGAMLIGGLCTWSLDFLLPAPLGFLAHAAGATAGMCTTLLEGCVFFLARLPGAIWPVADPSAAWLALLAGGCAASVALFRAGRYAPAGLGLLILVAAEWTRPAACRPWPGEARLTFLSVGHGDAAVMELPGAVFLIDAGDSPRIARQIILPFLQSRGIRRLDAVLITHPDLDHYGGAAALLDRIPVGAFWGPTDPAEASPTWNCLRDQARAHGIHWTVGAAGQRLYRSGDLSLWMLGPDSSLAEEADNNRSLVCLLRTPRVNALFTGDVEGPGQLALASTWPLWRGAWLKAPHHGSDRTTLPCFPESVSPPRTAISSGRRRGFPGPKTLAALEGKGSVGITERDGALIWELGRNAARTRAFGGGSADRGM